MVLQYVREQNRLQRALTILKTTASNHQPAGRYYEITPEGITLAKGAGSPAG